MALGFCGREWQRPYRPLVYVVLFDVQITSSNYDGFDDGKCQTSVLGTNVNWLCWWQMSTGGLGDNCQNTLFKTSLLKVLDDGIWSRKKISQVSSIKCLKIKFKVSHNVESNKMSWTCYMNALSHEDVLFKFSKVMKLWRLEVIRQFTHTSVFKPLPFW